MATTNDQLPQEEFDEYRAKTSRYRFMNQILLGVGGATVFGLVSVTGQTLFHTVLGAGAAASSAPVLWGLTAATLAWSGLAALAVLGVGCLYLGSKYLTKNIILDQGYQARRISVASRGHEVAIDPVSTQTPRTGVPDVAAQSAPAEEKSQENGQAWATRIASARTASQPAERVAADGKSWAERAQASAAEAPTTALRA